MSTDRLSATFSALADPTRRAILARLALGETSVTELAEPFDISLPAVSRHLKVLEGAGLIVRGREAQWWGPDGFRTTTSAYECKPGGVWRFVMHGPDGRDYENRITFEVVEPPKRLVYRHGGGDDVEPVQFRTTVTFEDLGGKTKLTM